LVFCAVAGRCLLLEANHCVTFEGSGVERIDSKLRGSKAGVKWFVFPVRRPQSRKIQRSSPWRKMS
jgi:hypothetical protein